MRGADGEEVGRKSGGGEIWEGSLGGESGKGSWEGRSEGGEVRKLATQEGVSGGVGK